MKNLFQTNRRVILGLTAAVMAIAFVATMSRLSQSSDELSDGVKRQKVADMYDQYKQQFPEVRDVSTRKAMILAAEGKAVLIDIREPREQMVSMLPGAITEKEFMQDPEKYSDAVKIAYCTISYRSGKFAQKLQRQGIPVYNLRGGLLAWVHEGGKVYDQIGEANRIHVYGREWNLGPKRYQTVW